MSTEFITPDKPHVVASFNTNDQARVLQEIWRRTIGKDGKSVPDSRTYALIGIKYTSPMSPAEASLHQQLLAKEGVSIAASDMNRTKRVVNGAVGPFNYYTIHVKFEGKGSQDIGITIHKGLTPEPGKMVADYRVANMIRIDPYLVTSDAEWIMFMDLHPMNAGSPLRWSNEELKACGIEYLRLDNPEILRTPKFEWKSSQEAAVENRDVEKKFDKAVVTKQMMSLPFEQKRALLLKMRGNEILNSIDQANMPRDIVVLLSDAIDADVEQVKRHMLGEYPKIVEALRLAQIQNVIKFEDNRWKRLSGPGEDAEYIDIQDGYLLAERDIDKVVFLANVLYGKEGRKSGIHFETLQDIIGITRAKNEKYVPRPEKGDLYEKPKVEEDVDVTNFTSVFTAAIESGDIIIDLRKRRMFYNPGHTDEDTNEGLPGAFSLKGKDDEEQNKNAVDHVMKTLLSNPDKMKKVLERLKSMQS